MTYFANSNTLTNSETTGDKYTAKGYNGTGTATVNNMVVNFTKVIISPNQETGYQGGSGSLLAAEVQLRSSK